MEGGGGPAHRHDTLLCAMASASFLPQKQPGLDAQIFRSGLVYMQCRPLPPHSVPPLTPLAAGAHNPEEIALDDEAAGDEDTDAICAGLAIPWSCPPSTVLAANRVYLQGRLVRTLVLLRPADRAQSARVPAKSYSRAHLDANFWHTHREY